MAKLVRVFVSAAHRRLIAVLVWIGTFLAVAAGLATFGLHQSTETVLEHTREAAGHFTRLRTNLLSTIDAMHAELDAEPCSAEFNGQLRRIAYRPDGLNEFLYAPGGGVHCSVSMPALPRPAALGMPDLELGGENGIALWLDHPLDFIGLPGETGSIVMRDPYAAIVPPFNPGLSLPAWLSLEVVMAAPDGRWWHRFGTNGIYAQNMEQKGGLLQTLLRGDLRSVSCDPRGLHCFATQARLLPLLSAYPLAVMLALVAAAILAQFATQQAVRLMKRYWSFEARFRRHLDETSVICAYQPVMDLQTGEITGYEVLARWRDLDDGVVFPDRFIEILRRQGMTLAFTDYVARRALAELTAFLPEGRRLQVNFNIFPCDLDSEKLLAIFAGFIARPDRFDLVLEIIESDDIPETAQREIEALRSAGVRTYIDDFCTGYSNMQNLAALSVDGVKLDRAFAMAPDDSMMAQMLDHAVDMIHATGRVMVVEGVETAERLALLRKMQARIDFVQGYFISRPLDIASFAAFIASAPDRIAPAEAEAMSAVAAA